MTTSCRGCVCELWEWYCNSDRSPTGFTSQPGQVDLTLPSCLGCRVQSHRSVPSSVVLVSTCVGSSVLSSQGHTLLIGFFGELIWSKPVHGRLCPSLMYPRAHDDPVSWAKHRLWFFLDGCLRSVCLCALAGAVSMACPWFVWGRNGSGGSPKQRKPDESNALCLGEHCGP